MLKLTTPVLAIGLMLAATASANAMGGGGSPGGFFGASQSAGAAPAYVPPQVFRSYNAVHRRHRRHG